MDIINIIQEQITMNIGSHSNQISSRIRLKIIIISILIVLLSFLCLYKYDLSDSKTRKGFYPRLNNKIIDMDLLSQKELQLNYEDIISILLYEPLNGTWVSNSTIQGNNATQGIAQLIFRKYNFESLFNYDLVLYDYEADKIPQGIIISNNESFSLTNNQNNSMNISIDNNTFTVISTQPMCIKSITKYSSQLIMVSTQAKFTMILNKYSLNGSLKLEIDDVSINLNIQPGKINFYDNIQSTIFLFYFFYLVFTLNILNLYKYQILISNYSPYSLLLNAFFSTIIIFKVLHLMLITKVYLYYLPLVILQIFMAFYWYPKNSEYLILKQCLFILANGLTYRQRYSEFISCYKLYAFSLLLWSLYINYSYYYSWKFFYYIFLITTFIPQMKHIRYYNYNMIIRLCSMNFYQNGCLQLLLINLRKYQANVFIHDKIIYNLFDILLIYFLEVSILVCLKNKNRIKINMFNMNWEELYCSMKEVESNDKYGCCICLDYHIGNHNQRDSFSDASIIHNNSSVKSEQVKKERQEINILPLFRCCFRKKKHSHRTYNEDTLLMTECKHSFHAGCLEQWLQKSELCPMCNTLIK